MDESIRLRQLYADICRGYSQSIYSGNPLYIKHFSVFDYTDIDTIREEAFNAVVKRGVKTEADKRKWLESKGLWSKKDDQEIAMQENYLDSLRKTRSKMPYKAQVVQIDKQIAEATVKLNKCLHKREKLIGKTAEQVADQRVEYEYMKLALFRDSGLTFPLLTSTTINTKEGPNGCLAIDDLGDEEVNALLGLYIQASNRFSQDNLKRIAIAPFFLNYFGLCGDDPTRFFAKPVYSLTLNQINLLSYGTYFKSLMSQNNLPPEIVNDPDKIEDYIARSRNMRSLVNKAGTGDRVALIGATAEDFKALGVEDGSATIQADINRGVKSGMEAAKTREVVRT